jgi:hypothetical protein
MSDPNSQRLPDREPETRPAPPPTLPEMPDAQVTRVQPPSNRTHLMPQPVEPPGYGPKKRKRSPRPARRDNPLAIPLWSVALMLLGVGGMVVLIVGLVLLLGGTPALEKPPRVIILTAALTSESAGEDFSLLASATIPAQYNATPVAPLALQGPTLEPVAITPTLESIGIGKMVMVEADEPGLNIRAIPGTIGTDIRFVAPPGQSFVVTDGPTQADGLTWWKVQNPFDTTESGWAASSYLQVAPGS